jgi:glutamyl-tRNA synthetase
MPYAEELIKNGWAYYAFDSSEALEQARKEQEEGNTFIYNHTNRELLDTSLYYQKETESRITNGQSYVIRFKTPVNETTFTRYDSW